MKKLLLCAGLIIALVSCSDSSSTEPEAIEPDNSIRLNKMVKIDYDSNGGVNSVFTTNYRYELTESGFLHKEKVGNSGFYINLPLLNILTGVQRLTVNG